MIEILKAILFGIIEGITEWLPISSTGHMILLDELVQLKVSPEFYSLFQVVIQLGAIFAVVLIFWKKIWPFGRKNNKAPLAKEGIGSYVKTDIFVLWFHILVSCIPAAIVGVLWDDLFEALFYNPWVVAIMLILFGIAFIFIERSRAGRSFRITKVSQITYTDALLIGAFQLIAAIFPGTSRSGATIVGALLIGISRTAAAEYTFYLAIPVMMGASLLKVLKIGLSFPALEIAMLLIGMVTAFIVSVLVIGSLMRYIRKHDFQPFGWYRIALGIIVLVAFIFI